MLVKFPKRRRKPEKHASNVKNDFATIIFFPKKFK